MSPVTINKKASLLARRPEVATVIGGVRGEAEAAAAEKLGYTIADSMALADEAFAAGRAAGQTGTMVSAATLKAKLAGHLVERKEVRSGPLEDADIQDLLLMRKRLAEERADEQAAQELLGEAPAQPQEQDGNRPIKRTLQ